MSTKFLMSVGQRPVDLVIVNSDGSQILTPPEIPTNSQKQFRVRVVDSVNGWVMDENPAGQEWLEDGLNFTVDSTGLVTVEPAAPVNQSVSLRASALYKGVRLTAENLTIIVTDGTPPPPPPPPDVWVWDSFSGLGQTIEVNKELPNRIFARLSKNGVGQSDILIFVSCDNGGSVIEQVLTGDIGFVQIRATAGPNPGVHTVTLLSNNGVVGTATFTAIVNTAERHINLISSPNSGIVGQPLAAPSIFEAVDGDGDPVIGVTMAFSTPNGGSVSPPSAITDSNGRAQTTLTLGSGTGPQQLIASITDGDGATLTIQVQANPSGGITEVSMPLPARTGIGPLILIGSAPFSSMPEPFRTIFNKFLQANYEPVIWSRWLNDPSVFLFDTQYGVGGRLGYAIITGQLYGSAATDESDTTQQLWGKARRLWKYSMDNYYYASSPPGANWNAFEPWRSGYDDLIALSYIEPTWEPVRARESIKTQAPAQTTDPFNSFLMTNPSSSPRIIYQGVRALRLAHMMGLSYQNSPLNVFAFDPSHGSWATACQWLINRWLSSPNVNPDFSVDNYAYPDGFIKSPAHESGTGFGGDPPYQTLPLMEELLFSDEYVAPNPAAITQVIKTTGRWRDFWLNILKPKGIKHFPERDWKGDGDAMSYATPSHAILNGICFRAFWMVWQETGDPTFRQAGLEMIQSIINTGRSPSPTGANGGRELAEYFRTYGSIWAMEQGVPWRASLL